MLANIGFGPDEGFGILVVRFDEGIDVLPELLDRGEGGPSEGVSLKDGKPDLDLIEPGGPGRSEVEVHVGCRLSQRSFFGLWVLSLSRMTWMAVLE